MTQRKRFMSVGNMSRFGAQEDQSLIYGPGGADTGSPTPRMGISSGSSFLLGRERQSTKSDPGASATHQLRSLIKAYSPCLVVLN